LAAIPRQPDYWFPVLGTVAERRHKLAEAGRSTDVELRATVSGIR